MRTGVGPRFAQIKFAVGVGVAALIGGSGITFRVGDGDTRQGDVAGICDRKTVRYALPGGGNAGRGRGLDDLNGRRLRNWDIECARRCQGFGRISRHCV